MTGWQILQTLGLIGLVVLVLLACAAVLGWAGENFLGPFGSRRGHTNRKHR